MDSPTGIAVDADDNVYVTNQADDLIQKFAADGSFLLSWGGTGTASGQMKDPSAIAIDPSGFVYVADKDMQRIQKFDLSGNYLMQWGSFGTANGQMKSPQGIAVDGGGHVFVADTGNHRIQKFTSNGVFMTSWGGLTQGTGNGQFRSPSGIGIDADGDVWVADSENNRLQQFTATGTFISKVAGTGVSQLDGKFDSPSDIDFDSFGTMYVVDRDNARVQRLSSDGAYISKFGDGGLDVARFSAPGGVVVDSSGRVLVADSGNHRVQTFIDANGPDTTVLTGPAAVSSSTSASFTFAANEPDSTYECKMDNGAFEACTSGKSYVGLAPGPHAFSVRATDALLNVGDPNTYPWTIDVTPPGVSITGGPALLTASTGANFSFEATEEPRHVPLQCRCRGPGRLRPSVLHHRYGGRSHLLRVRHRSGREHRPAGHVLLDDGQHPALGEHHLRPERYHEREHRLIRVHFRRSGSDLRVPDRRPGLRGMHVTEELLGAGRWATHILGPRR